MKKNSFAIGALVVAILAEQGERIETVTEPPPYIISVLLERLPHTPETEYGLPDTSPRITSPSGIDVTGTGAATQARQRMDASGLSLPFREDGQK